MSPPLYLVPLDMGPQPLVVSGTSKYHSASKGNNVLPLDLACKDVGVGPSPPKPEITFLAISTFSKGYQLPCIWCIGHLGLLLSSKNILTKLAGELSSKNIEDDYSSHGQ